MTPLQNEDRSVYDVMIILTNCFHVNAEQDNPRLSYTITGQHKYNQNTESRISSEDCQLVV